MEYTDLDLNNMIAELEGYKPVIIAGMVKTNDSFNYAPIEHSSNKGTNNYNKNKAKLYDLMVKYKVTPDYDERLVGILTQVKNSKRWEYVADVSYDSESEIPRAIIMCILKSENII